MKNILPAKNYTHLSTLNQLCLPIDVGVLIPPDDPVRLLVFILKQLDLNPLYEAYNAYCERRRREQSGREREAAEQGAGTLIEAERKDTQPGRGDEKKKDGRPSCDIVVLLSIVLYGAMEHIYSSRALAKACRQNINFIWLLQGSPPPSHGMINASEGTAFSETGEGILEQAKEVRAVWRKNVERYEEGRKEKIRVIIRELNRSEGRENADVVHIRFRGIWVTITANGKPVHHADIENFFAPVIRDSFCRFRHKFKKSVLNRPLSNSSE
jgi:hypothetical protein